MAAREVPHRAAKKGTANAKERIGTKQQVPSAFFSQPQWHAAFREIQWRDLPAEAIIPYVVQQNGRPCFIIAHLFSGRRRKEDFHRWLQHCSIEYDIDLCILSLDTAISPSAGDIHRSAMAPPWAMLPCRHHCGFPSWHTVWDLFGGQVYTCTCRMPATVAETFALSRTPFRPAWPQHSGTFTNTAGHWFCSAGIGSPLPPPSARWIGGVWAPRSTGWFRSTHSLEGRTYRIACLRHPDVRPQTICQYEWGAPSVKPTGLLGLRVPGLIGALRTAVIPHVRKPQQAAIGCNEEGAHFTAMDHKVKRGSCYI